MRDLGSAVSSEQGLQEDSKAWPGAHNLPGFLSRNVEYEPALVAAVHKQLMGKSGSAEEAGGDTAGMDIGEFRNHLPFVLK